MGATEMITKGKAKYLAGINRIGTEKYFECGGKGGIRTAICLKEAKAKAGSAETWANAWATAMA